VPLESKETLDRLVQLVLLAYREILETLALQAQLVLKEFKDRLVLQE
jgi:hypothetical protein